MLPAIVVELVAMAANVIDYMLVRQEIRRFRPDIVYKRHGRFDVGAGAAAVAGQVRVLLEVNCLFTQPPYVQFEPLHLAAVAVWMERRALRQANTAYAVSSPLALSAGAFAGRPVEVVANGADATLFDPDRASAEDVRRRFGLGSRFVVGWTGVVREWHGLELLLDAVARLPGTHLLIVGDGPGRPGFEQRAGELGLASRLSITGRIDHERMPDYIAAMDACVVADERTRIASPMKLLEYMAMGKAVVAPDLANIRDVVVDRHNGLLFVHGEAASLTACLRSLVDDRALCVHLGAAARETVVTKRTWRQVASTALSLMHGGAGSHGPTPGATS